MQQNIALTKEQMMGSYGEFYSRSASFPFEHEHVPELFRALIPYAEFWAFPEEGDRGSVFDAATPAIQLNLKTVVEALDDEFDDWFEEVMASENHTEAYYAFAYLRMAADSFIP